MWQAVYLLANMSVCDTTDALLKAVRVVGRQTHCAAGDACCT